MTWERLANSTDWTAVAAARSSISDVAFRSLVASQPLYAAAARVAGLTSRSGAVMSVAISPEAAFPVLERVAEGWPEGARDVMLTAFQAGCREGIQALAFYSCV